MELLPLSSISSLVFARLLQKDGPPTLCTQDKETITHQERQVFFFLSFSATVVLLSWLNSRQNFDFLFRTPPRLAARTHHDQVGVGRQWLAPSPWLQGEKVVFGGVCRRRGLRQLALWCDSAPWQRTQRVLLLQWEAATHGQDWVCKELRYSQVEKRITWMNSDKPQNSKTQSHSLYSLWMCKEQLLLARMITMTFFGGLTNEDDQKKTPEFWNQIIVKQVGAIQKSCNFNDKKERLNLIQQYCLAQSSHFFFFFLLHLQ